MAIARKFASTLQPGAVILLYGELGAGKTLFTRGVVSQFDTNVAVTSPTFSLVNTYPTTPPINHFDLYRIRNDSELIDLGFEEYLDDNGIVIIEWGEKCERLLSGRYFRINLAIIGGESRDIIIEEVEHVSSRN